MNVIVSNNAINYEGFLKVKKLSEVEKITGKIDCLVYHKSNESSEEKVMYLTNLKDSVPRIVYIRNKEDCDKAIKLIVVGSGGKYFDDEFFLENAQELLSLILNLDEVNALAEMNGTGVVSDFFNRYLSEGSSGFNREYLKIVKEAVLAMTTDYKKKDLELLQMSETATELFAHTASMISKVEEEKDKLKESVKALQEAKEEIISVPKINTPSVLFFPIVSYLKDKNIIRIKEIGNVSYLTSFSFGLRLYLENVKYVKAKLIIILPVGEMYNKQYQEYKWVTQTNCSTMDGYYNSIVFTNYPTKEVMNRLLDDTDYDTFIIVDRLKSSEKHLLNCKGSIKYAVESIGKAEKFNIKSIASFYLNIEKVGLFTLKYDDKYPSEKEQRERYYLREYSVAFESLISSTKGSGF